MPNPIKRLTAALADRYRIERELGAGGMTGGGSVPKWTRGGAELVYGTSLGEDSTGQPRMRIMSALVEPGPDFSVQTPRELFIEEFGTTTSIRSFDVTADGERFLVIMGPRPKSPPGELRFIANWTAELKRLTTQRTQ